MDLIRFKRTLSDCAVDGRIPATVHIHEQVLLQESRKALDRWIERVNAQSGEEEPPLQGALPGSGAPPGEVKQVGALSYSRRGMQTKERESNR